MSKIIFENINTLFLDVGNTLISIDFVWICTELRKLEIQCDAGQLQKAEASARPVISKRIQEFKGRKGLAAHVLYLELIFSKLPEKMVHEKIQIIQIVEKLVPILYPDGNVLRLWSYVLPGVREALQKLKEMNLKIVAVSNGDGTVEAQLTDQNLISYFDTVIDSHAVGVSKPDPKIFEYALRVSRTAPERTLFVGDIYSVDIVGAWSAGLSAILLDPYDDWHDVDCERITDLLSLYSKLKTSR